MNQFYIRNLLRHFLAPLLLLSNVLLLSTSAAAQTEQDARQEMAGLRALISTAETQGIDASKEKMTLEVAELFLSFANWDEANKATSERHFQARKPLPQASQDRYTAAELAGLLPDFERQQVMELLDESTAYLKTLVSGKHTRKPATTIDWTALEVQGNKIVQNGQPVFLNEWTWGPSGLELGYFVPGNLEQTTDGAVRLRRGVEAKLEQISNSGKLGTPFLGQTSLPRYLTDAHPDVLKAQTAFTKFDIGTDRATCRISFEMRSRL
jgi:beta-galactosidase